MVNEISFFHFDCMIFNVVSCDLVSSNLFLSNNIHQNEIKLFAMRCYEILYNLVSL